MVFKINLAACLVFVVGSIVIALLGALVIAQSAPTPMMFGWNNLLFVLFLWSPALLWAGGAWALRKAEGCNAVWLMASIVLMGAELFALGVEVDQARREAITREYTQSLLSFVVVLGEWAIGLPLLIILAVIWRFYRSAEDEG
jgi:hypothetical protein